MPSQGAKTPHGHCMAKNASKAKTPHGSKKQNVNWPHNEYYTKTKQIKCCVSILFHSLPLLQKPSVSIVWTLPQISPHIFAVCVGQFVSVKKCLSSN